MTENLPSLYVSLFDTVTVNEPDFPGLLLPSRRSSLGGLAGSSLGSVTAPDLLSLEITDEPHILMRQLWLVQHP